MDEGFYYCLQLFANCEILVSNMHDVQESADESGMPIFKKVVLQAPFQLELFAYSLNCCPHICLFEREVLLQGLHVNYEILLLDDLFVMN